ncbi:peroxisomal N(1)-acetyl-spermine/spermidine oxidase-like isoform X2 [Bufo gargarizans]|uniref:peroxisomal N(1)-acetyl-spermine/spermidine oxidase-like isoform X2 n=1 Tax=Bufo gargarizans TaxID=30331 RepID=UPI001CF35811|nr:peroxisomal N(1)-acetyl-spermine/spermidine oxidase-like isoform X2 [Bufo gargarizans]
MVINMQTGLATRLLLFVALPLVALSDTKHNSMDSEEPEPLGPQGPVVVIIGAGISGIAAAEKLHKHGFQNIKVLEATGRTGGRIRTERFAKGLVEIGAQWIHGPSPGNPVFELASQFGLLHPDTLLEEKQKIKWDDQPSSLPVIYSSAGRKIDPEVMANIIELHNTWVTQVRNFTNGDCDPEASVGQFIREKIVHSSQEWDKEQTKKNMAFLGALLKLESCVTSAHSMDQVALCPFGEYTMFPGLDCTFPKGFESLVNHMKAPLPSGTVLLNKAVKSIHWHGSFPGSNSHVYPVQVQCEDGDSFVADHVIVTVPLGFLKKQSVDFFSPPLPPSKLQAIKNLGFGTNNKIVLEFEKPFWDSNSTHIQIIWEGESPLTEPKEDLKQNWMKKIAGFVVLEPPEQMGHVLCGFIAGEQSKYMETLTDEEILSTMTDFFRKFTGDPELPPPISMVRSQWHSQPYTGGSYSYVAVGSSGIDVDNLAEPLPTDKEVLKPLQVLFAGEATERNFHSTTHGALMSGWREAQRLIDRYSDPGANVSKAKL